ncbi:hypothetical protein PU02_0414 [Bartonella ancashensis]|uniref:Uncharacterized protein n=1 Tax=Bartonella ancashensis TaxID=1318743 RepID=A0A0M5KTK9_9HYPH|nr:hypothetical protein PU02_0414 [Bartonella ancashensis]
MPITAAHLRWTQISYLKNKNFFLHKKKQINRSSSLFEGKI